MSINKVNTLISNIISDIGNVLRSFIVTFNRSFIPFPVGQSSKIIMTATSVPPELVKTSFLRVKLRLITKMPLAN